MAMSKTRWICTLIMVVKIFAYDTFISGIPAFFIISIPEVISVKSLFIIAVTDLVIMTYVNFFVFRQYYERLKGNKTQYFVFSLLCFMLYFSVCMFVCMKFDYIKGIYLYLPLGLFNYFSIPWKTLIIIFFAPMLAALIIAPYIKIILNYLYSNIYKKYENF